MSNTKKSDNSYINEVEGEYKGYKYVVKLQRMGHRCGYVQVLDNKLFDNIYTCYNNWQCTKYAIECHGGLTFCDRTPGAYLPGHNWIGFDCGHSYDAPDVEAVKAAFNLEGKQWICEYPKALADRGAVCRDTQYVESECKQIIERLIKLMEN